MFIAAFAFFAQHDDVMICGALFIYCRFNSSLFIGHLCAPAYLFKLVFFTKEWCSIYLILSIGLYTNRCSVFFMGGAMARAIYNKSNRPGRVIFVDDDVDVRQVVRESFQRSEAAKGVVFASCGSGQELLDRFNELQPALILLDLHMPNMNGLDFMHVLRESKDGHSVPLMFLTGETRIEMKQEYEDIGVIGIIHKPFDPKTLPEATFEIWSREGFEGSDGQVLKDLMMNKLT